MLEGLQPEWLNLNTMRRQWASSYGNYDEGNKGCAMRVNDTLRAFLHRGALEVAGSRTCQCERGETDESTPFLGRRRPPQGSARRTRFAMVHARARRSTGGGHDHDHDHGRYPVTTLEAWRWWY